MGPGPLLDEHKKIHETRIVANSLLEELCQKVGAMTFHVWSMGGLAGFVFAQQPDLGAWKKPDKNGLYLPRKNTQAGKAILEQIRSIPKIQSLQEAVSIQGMCHIFPVLEDSDARCRLRGFVGGPLFLIVPWRNVEPETVNTYLEQKKAGIKFCSMLDHLQWKPTDDLQECKEWEMLKAFEDHKDTLSLAPSAHQNEATPSLSSPTPVL